MVAPPPPNILLVDDHVPNLLALEALLEPLALGIFRATSGTEAIEHLTNGDFAAVLLDVQMPGMDGFETAAVIRKQERTRDVPIIFVTAGTTSTDDRGRDTRMAPSIT